MFLLAGCKQMRCIKINMVYLPMHHFLNVSGFPCFSLPHFILLFSLSHFKRTVRDPIRCHPWSPVPGPQGSSICYVRLLHAAVGGHLPARTARLFLLQGLDGT